MFKYYFNSNKERCGVRSLISASLLMQMWLSLTQPQRKTCATVIMSEHCCQTWGPQETKRHNLAQWRLWWWWWWCVDASRCSSNLHQQHHIFYLPKVLERWSYSAFHAPCVWPWYYLGFANPPVSEMLRYEKPRLTIGIIRCLIQQKQWRDGVRCWVLCCLDFTLGGYYAQLWLDLNNTDKCCSLVKLTLSNERRRVA